MAFLPDGRRLQLQDSPIDLILEARGVRTILANAVDLSRHANGVRGTANDVRPGSDLGARQVTRYVDELSSREIARALEARASFAHALLTADLFNGAASVCRATAVVALNNIYAVRQLRSAASETGIKRVMHA